jgi:cobalt-precorrin 5A hydrolase
MVNPDDVTRPQRGVAILALTLNGAKMARALAATLAAGKKGEATLFLERRFYQQGEPATPFDLPARPVIQQAFREFSGLVIFLSAGACIRLLAPLLADKRQDPAVVCVDDAGKFCVSLLSGHIGGADRLAETVAECLGATPVITSASHASGTLAVDLLGQEFGWRIDAATESITRASAAVVNRRPVGICQEAGEPDWWDGDGPLPENIAQYPTLQELADAGCEASLVITDRVIPIDTMQSGPSGPPTVVYRPRSLVAGMGCRRGVPVEELESLLYETFAEHSLCIDSLGCIATAELKRGEEGLMQLAERHGVPLEHYTAPQLNSLYGTEAGDLDATVTEPPTRSERAHALVGVWGVAEPAALLASGAGQLLVSRKKTTRATIAVARRSYPGGGH